MKKNMIEKLENGFTLSDGTKDYISMLEEYLFEGYEISIAEFVYSTSSDLNEYFDKYARTYLSWGWPNDALNFGGTEEEKTEARIYIAKLTWEELKQIAEDEEN